MPMGAKDIFDEIGKPTDKLSIVMPLVLGYATVSEEVARRYVDWPIPRLNSRDPSLILRRNNRDMRWYSPLIHIFVSREVARLLQGGLISTLPQPLGGGL
jgi:hypothetical protein